MRTPSRPLFVSMALAFVAFTHGCGDDPGGGAGGSGGGAGTGAGSGGGAGTDGGTGGGSGSSCGRIAAVVRDFDPATHPDFEDENPGHVITGLVEEALGADRNPVYAYGDTKMGAIENAASYAQWYEDVADINIPFDIALSLTETPAGSGVFVFDDSFFFPIDGMGFGNSGQDANGVWRNFHFTTEVHTTFIYEGGERFTFRGDDDLWLFIDGNLAIDLGGVHGAEESTVELDTLGLTPGETYPMDIFHAERHTNASDFRIETTIRCFIDPIPL